MVSATSEAVHDISLADVLFALAQPAVLLSADRRIVATNQAYRNQFCNGRRPFGRFCHEVSHGFAMPCSEAGVMCPLERSQATLAPSRAVHSHEALDGPRCEEVSCYPVVDELGRTSMFIEVFRAVRMGERVNEADGPTLIGRSRSFNAMMEMATRVAATDLPVLLLGESGTGKGLLARAIHNMSSRAEAAFVHVDCSGLSEALFESELFGHERGAFTGAFCRKLGLVEVCAGGTLFLDELGDIPLSLQVKLLRLLETRSFRRVGSTQELCGDFRLICATHRDIHALVKAERFRHDLFYRIATFPIRIPPLRERLEDVPVLIEALRGRVQAGLALELSEEAMAALCGYDFPGNIRELLNIIQRAYLLCDRGRITLEHLPPQLTQQVTPVAQSVAADPSGFVPLAEVEARYLRWAVTVFEGDRKALAEALGVTERTLYRKLKQLRGASPSWTRG